MTDLRIVPLPAPTDITPTVVETLEALLEIAKKGDVSNFLFVGICRDGGALSARSFEPTSPRYALIGALHDRLLVLHGIMEKNAVGEIAFSPEAE